jgi:hypothetical protein
MEVERKMALKPRQIAGMPSGAGDRSRRAAAPMLFKRDLEEHRRSPRVKARLERVEQMLAEETR